MERFLGSFTKSLTQVFEYHLIFTKSFISRIVVNSLRFMETNLRIFLSHPGQAFSPAPLRRLGRNMVDNVKFIKIDYIS